MLAEYGQEPWGKIDRDDPAIVPFAAGIGDRVRVVYSPDPRPVTVSNLRPAAKYRITKFDPETGIQVREQPIRTDGNGSLKLLPLGCSLDWVVGLQLP